VLTRVAAEIGLGTEGLVAQSSVTAVCVCGKTVSGVASSADGTVPCVSCGRRVVVDPEAAARAFGTTDATKSIQQDKGDPLQDSTGSPFVLKIDDALSASVVGGSADSGPRLPEKLGPYRVLGRLGQGGMGVVYKGHDEVLDRLVALKVLARARNDASAEEAGLEREARAIAAITHPNVVQVYAAGEHEGLGYFAMELVNGPDLREVLEKEGPLPVARARRYMSQAVLGLRAAARKSIFHRDVKPANLLLDVRDDQVKVADFGLAKRACVDASMGGTSLIAGTPLYVAPEVIRDGVGDHRADIYSLGATFYHLLAGKPPFGGEAAVDALVGHARTPAPDLRAVRSDVPASFAALIRRCMEKDPSARFAKYDELLGELEPGRTPSGVGKAIPSEPRPAVAPVATPVAPPPVAIVTPVRPPQRPVEYIKVELPPPERPRRSRLHYLGFGPFVVAMVAVVGGLVLAPWHRPHHAHQAPAPAPDCSFEEFVDSLKAAGPLPIDVLAPRTVSQARGLARRLRLPFPHDPLESCPTSGLPFAISCGPGSPVLAWHVHDLEQRSVVYADSQGRVHTTSLYEFLRYLRTLNNQRESAPWVEVVKSIRPFLPENAGEELRRLQASE
jgi:serine/threonine protein kinase